MDSSQESTIRNIGIAVIVLLLLSTIGALVFNSKNKKSLNAEKLRTESLLSEKLQVEKELDRIKNELAALTAKSAETEKMLAEAQESITQKDRRIYSLSRTGSNLTKTMEELEALKLEKADLDNAHSKLKAEYERLASQNSDLQKSITALESEKSDISKKLASTELYDSDNFVVYGSRGKKREKLTFWACRTKKLNLNFEVPQSLTDAISFIITTPSGNTITPEDKSMTWNIEQDSRNFTASLSGMPGEFEQSRKVTLTYARKEKLSSGEYKIQVLSNGIDIGNCRVKLK